MTAKTWVNGDVVAADDLNRWESGDAGKAAVTADLADSTSAIREQLSTALGVLTFSANDRGADRGADAAINTAAFQAANDDAAAAGGGVVTALPGTYSVNSITQDSFVHFNLPDVEFSSATGDVDVIASRLTAVTGTSISSDDLTVVTGSSTAGLNVGQTVSVRYAGPVHPTQNTTLTAAIDNVQTTGITLTATTGFLTSGTMLVDNELINYTGLSGTTLTGVTRGANGSTPAAHAAGGIIGLAAVHWSTVASITSASEFVLTDPADRPVTGSQIRFGVYKAKITGVEIYVNRNVGTTPRAYGVNWSGASKCRMTDIYVENGDGGIYLAQGTTGCKLRNIHMHNCGLPEVPLGSALWLFQHVNKNWIDGITVTGYCWIAETLDDRSDNASEWDGPCDKNLLINHQISINQPGTGTNAINVTSSNRNVFAIGYIEAASVIGTGLFTSQGTQGITHDGVLATCDNNKFMFFDIHNCRTPWDVSAGVDNITAGLTHDGALADPKNGSNLALGIKQARTTNVALGGGPEVKASIDPPSIPANSTVDVSVTVTGAQVGNQAFAYPNSAPPSGLSWNAYVSAANTVMVRFTNATVAAIDPAVATWRVRVTGNTS